MPTGVIVASSKAFTKMVVVSVSPQVPGIEYVITCVPGPAVDGSKIPVAAFVIPVPLQIPPGSAAESVNGATEAQNGPTGVIVAS